MTTSAIQFESPEKNFAGDVMDKNYSVKTFFQNIFTLRRPRVANYFDIKNVTTFIEATIKIQSISVFLDRTEVADF